MIPEVGFQDSLINIKINYILYSKSGDPRPYLEVRVFGKTIRALLDSGASHSVLGKEGLWILERFPAKLKPIENKYVETADGQKHMIEGIVDLPVTLEARTRNLGVIVVPSLNQSLILGIDFWNLMQIVTDIYNRTWEFAPTKVGLASIWTKGGLQSEEHLDPEQKKRLEEFIENQFKQQTKPLGRTSVVEHRIDTGDAQPIKQRYYPMSPSIQKIVNEELDKMLELGVVTPSKSAWSSPIVLVDKPDGSKRFCVNFRQLNAVTKRDAYPLPQVTTILDRLRDSRYLSSLDIKSAYWQIPLAADSREKTAFTVQGRGLFEFVTMPFGLHNAPATWQRFIDQIIGADLEPHVFVYLDDIIVVTQHFDHHLEVLEKIFNRLRAVDVTLNQEKCCICRKELRYLGYVVDSRGLRVDPEKVQAIVQIPVPRNQKEVRQFCGTASWYRRFIPDFASRLYPLTSLLRKNKRFTWTDEAQNAFEDIRSCLVKAPILTCPDFNKPFIISCDASGVGLGAVLTQEGEQVIAYASRTLSRTEQKFSATERECLAVIWAVEKFRPYVEGSHFTIITDHYSLLWLHNLKDPQGRLARWALRLQPYSYTLVHRKGKEHVVPDMLSRSVEQEQEMVPVVSEVLKVEDGWYKKMLREVTEKGDQYPTWRVEKDLLWKHIPSRTALWDITSEWKRVIPKEDRAKIIHMCHDEPTAGHLGSFKTFSRVQNQFYWPKMRQDISKYVARCRVCQTTKSDNQRPAGMMGSRRGVDRPWKMIAADLLGPLPRSTSGYKYILVVTDTFSKFTVLFPLRAATSSLVAKHLEQNIFLMFGIPTYLICDNGAEFSGRALKTLATEYKTKILYNASRHPQANPTERVNQTIGNMLRAFVGDNHRLWDQQLPKIGFALRTAKHEATGYTPAFLNFGRELTLRTKEAEENGETPEVDETESYGRKMEELKNVYQEVETRLKSAHRKNAVRYNLRRRQQDFRVGERVLKRNFPQSNAVNYFSTKLAPKFTGPFIISKKVSPLVYQLKKEDGSNLGNWHVSDLKRFIA